MHTGELGEQVVQQRVQVFADQLTVSSLQQRFA
jgi:hypothetical protein